MNYMINKLCCCPNCNLMALPNHNYCQKHLEESNQRRQQWLEEHKPFENAKRANTELYNTARWRRLRKAKLELNPACELCGSQSNLQIHHKRPPRGDEVLFFNLDNLQTICINCHRKITSYEIKQRKSDE